MRPLSFYKKINEELLTEYAYKAGLGGNEPADYKEFIKILTPKSKILEVGCGPGRLGKLLTEKFDYYGIDFNEYYLKRFNHKNVEFISFEDYNKKGFAAILFP